MSQGNRINSKEYEVITSITSQHNSLRKRKQPSPKTKQRQPMIFFTTLMHFTKKTFLNNQHKPKSNSPSPPPPQPSLLTTYPPPTHTHNLPSTFPYSATSTSFKWLLVRILLLPLSGPTRLCLIIYVLLGSIFGTAVALSNFALS